MAKNPQPSSSPPLADVPARERILRTAQHLFYQHGVRATGIDRIIAEAGVTKVTLYRHFPSKDELVEAFLERRHQAWIEWFAGAIARFRAAQSPAQRRAAPLAPLLHTAKEWFEAATFRGCAFANTVAELGATVPSILGIAARHKHEACDVIAALLPPDASARETAWAATLALDGAIANAQAGGQSVAASLEGLKVLLEALSKRQRAIGAR